MQLHGEGRSRQHEEAVPCPLGPSGTSGSSSTENDLPTAATAVTGTVSLGMSGSERWDGTSLGESLWQPNHTGITPFTRLKKTIG